MLRVLAEHISGILKTLSFRPTSFLANVSFGQRVFWPTRLLANASFWPTRLSANASFGQRVFFCQRVFFVQRVTNGVTELSENTGRDTHRARQHACTERRGNKVKRIGTRPVALKLFGGRIPDRILENLSVSSENGTCPLHHANGNYSKS